MVGFVIVLLAWNIPYVVDVFTPESEEQQDLRELWKPLQNRLSNAFNSLRRQPGERTDFYGASLAGPAGSTAGTLKDLADRAYFHYMRAEQYMREGNWKGYGEEIENLKGVLTQMKSQGN